MDKNFGHDSFAVIKGRVGTPLNNPGLNEDWVIWLGGGEIVRCAQPEAWFGEYNNAEQNLRNALEYVRLTSEVARQMGEMLKTMKQIDKIGCP